MSRKVLWITRTAVLTALLIVSQASTAVLGNTLITGSIVNLILIISVMVCDLMSGLAVAVISPICAKFFGIGPFWTLIPFIIAGNVVLVSMWYFIGNKSSGQRHISYIIALVGAAVAKFVVLYFGIVRVAIPTFLQLPEPKAVVISNIFSIPQLFTALIGGTFAVIMLPILKNAIREPK